ncbi:MAG TPA: hypothetical protein VJ436_04435 [Anaerolineales bacterium]|nr:hypothetical protein [Anaerolineales bacterium]
MRITPETLLKIARDTVSRRTRSDRDLLSVYLHGSLLDADPFLGGAADIDLVFVHNESVLVNREIERLTDEIHLDIAHHDRRDYRRARDLRLHPWLGPTIFRSRILYDPQHFMDFTQATVRGQFNRPDYILGRARSQAEHARQMWISLHSLHSPPGVQEVALYLRSVEHAANAVAGLSGPPLTERRFLLHFPARAQAIGRPGLYPGLLGLLGAPRALEEVLRGWLPAWESAYQDLPREQAPLRLHIHRRLYYLNAFNKILNSERPQDLLWPLLHTWTQAALLLPAESAHVLAWQAALEQLGLLSEAFAERVAALDAYLDTVEETLEEWARANGAE